MNSSNLSSAPAVPAATHLENLDEIFAAMPDPPSLNPDSKDSAQSYVAAVTAAPNSIEFRQWACEPNRVYRPTCHTVMAMPPAVYAIGNDDRGYFFQQITVSTDSLIILDDTASQRVVEGIRTFWRSRPAYLLYELIYKRGILLWGPAGSGKTATLMLLSQELLAMGGMVIMVGHPGMAGIALAKLRQIEPERPLILILEDIDEMIKEHGEHQILALLDGEHQIPNVVSIATTNYPERLGPRIINRPSRFDERIFIDTPNSLARARYLAHITKHDPVSSDVLAAWVDDSAGFSIAHLRELVAAVRCLGQPYLEVLARLKSMQRQVKALADYPSEQGGFSGMQQGQQAKSYTVNTTITKR